MFGLVHYLRFRKSEKSNASHLFDRVFVLLRNSITCPSAININGNIEKAKEIVQFPLFLALHIALLRLKNVM